MDPLKEEHAGDRTLSTSPALLSPSPGAHRKSPLRERIEAELSSLTAGLEAERAENARYAALTRSFSGQLSRNPFTLKNRKLLSVYSALFSQRLAVLSTVVLWCYVSVSFSTACDEIPRPRHTYTITYHTYDNHCARHIHRTQAKRPAGRVASKDIRCRGRSSRSACRALSRYGVCFTRWWEWCRWWQQRR